MAPILMATETLSMVGAFESGLCKVFFRDVRRMTFFASGNTADFLKVMTVLTASIHGRHFRMESV